MAQPDGRERGHSGRVREADVRRHLVGLDSVDVIVSGPAAFAFAPAIRTDLERRRGRISADAWQELEAVVLAIEFAALQHRSVMSASGHVSGLLGSDSPAPGDHQWRVTSVAEVADRLGITRRSVTRLLTTGELAGRRVGRDWAVDPESVASYEADREHR